jgi:leucyl aminopeptidase
MDIQITTQGAQNISCDALIVGVAQQQGKRLHFPDTATAVDTALGGLINELYRDGEFKASRGELLTLHPMGSIPAKRVLLVGLGSAERITAYTLRRAHATAARHLQQTGAKHIAVCCEWLTTDVSAPQNVQAQIEGVFLGLYTFRHYQHSEEESNKVTSLQFLAEPLYAEETRQAMQRGHILAEATNFARDLVNEPPNILTPGELAHRAQSMARQFGLECEIFDKAHIEALHMGGLLGVSGGSAEPPYFVVLRYHGAPDSQKKGLALVGKGITFDTGGISLKQPSGMDEMKGDMGGAAAVLGAMQAIAALKPRINVTGIVPTCENMPSGTAYHPGDILRIMNGKTIEIVNTDAEGRLILADGLSYATQEGYSPIIDLATLTGGIVVALGDKMTGLFCNNEELAQDIIEAGQEEGEKFWRMPLDEEYSEQIKSDIADIKQTGGREASSVTAAKILENFVGNTSWAHLDIAGTSYFDSKRPYQEKGATGVGVRTLAALALRMAQ